MVTVILDLNDGLSNGALGTVPEFGKNNMLRWNISLKYKLRHNFQISAWPASESKKANKDIVNR